MVVDWDILIGHSQSLLLSLAILCSLTMSLAFCVCCKKKAREEESEPAYAPIGQLDAVTNEKMKHNTTLSQGAVEFPLLHPNSKEGRSNRNGGSKNVHRALPSLPASNEEGTLTRESSTSELYATVEKSAPLDIAHNHTYSKIKHNAHPDPLYTKVDSASRTKTWNVPPSTSHHQYEYPKFTKPVRIHENVNKAQLIRDPVYCQVDNDSAYSLGSDTYTSVKGATKRGTSGDDPYKDPTYAYIPTAKPSGALYPTTSKNISSDLSELYTRPNRRHSDGKLIVAQLRGTSSALPAASPVPPIPEKRIEPRGRFGLGIIAPEPVLSADSSSGSAQALPRREPSYKYITVRESLETLRARLQAQRDNPTPPHRTMSDPSLHYYATITSEHSYEVVSGGVPSPQLQLYQVLQEHRPHVTLVQIDRLGSTSTSTDVEGTWRERPVSLLDRSFDSADSTIRDGGALTPVRTSACSDAPPQPPTSPIPQLPISPFTRKSPTKNDPPMGNTPSEYDSPIKIVATKKDGPPMGNTPSEYDSPIKIVPTKTGASVRNGVLVSESSTTHAISNNDIHFGCITFGSQVESNATGHIEFIVNESDKEKLMLKTNTSKKFNGHSARCSAERESPVRLGGERWKGVDGGRDDLGGDGEESVCFCHCSNPQPEKVLQVNLEEMERSHRSKSVDRQSADYKPMFSRL